MNFKKKTERVFIAGREIRRLNNSLSGDFQSHYELVFGKSRDVNTSTAILSTMTKASASDGYKNDVISIYFHGPKFPFDNEPNLERWDAYAVKYDIATGTKTYKQYYHMDGGLIGITYDENGNQTKQADFYTRDDALVEELIAEYKLQDPRPSGYVRGEWDGFGFTFNDGVPVRVKLYVYEGHEYDPIRLKPAQEK